jgi:hypothetical protein
VPVHAPAKPLLVGGLDIVEAEVPEQPERDAPARQRRLCAELLALAARAARIAESLVGPDPTASREVGKLNLDLLLLAASHQHARSEPAHPARARHLVGAEPV